MKLRSVLATCSLMMYLVACGGGDSQPEATRSDSLTASTPDPIEEGAGPTPTAPAGPVSDTIVVPDFETKSEGRTTALRVTNLRVGEEGITADITILNEDETADIELALDESQVLLLDESQAESWRAEYPRAFQEIDLDRLADESPSTSLALTVGPLDELPAQIAPGESWSGTIGSSTPVGDETTALIIVLKGLKSQEFDVTLYSADETRPYIGLRGEVTVTPLPPIAPLTLEEGDKISIAELGIDQSLVLLTVGRDGVMPNPGRDEIAIYDFAAFGEGLAGSPRGGNAVIAGLYATPDGPGPFQALLSLVPGDGVSLVYQGEEYQYSVVWKCAVPVTEFDEIIRRGNANTLTLLPGGSGGTQYVLRAELNAGSISSDCPPGATVFTGTEIPPP